MGRDRSHGVGAGAWRSRRVLARVAVPALIALGAPTGAAALAPGASVSISSPVHVRAKKAFAYNVSATDPNPGALLDLFVRPSTAPCAPSADVEAQQAQSIVKEQPVNGSFSLTKRIKPVRGASRFCAYVHTGATSTPPDATATAVFFARRRHGG